MTRTREILKKWKLTCNGKKRVGFVNFSKTSSTTKNLCKNSIENSISAFHQMDALKIYLKCWINLILHYRNIYPATSFALETFNVFNLPINFPINRNPILIDYIENLIQDFLEVLKHSQKVLDESSLDILNELAPKEPLESLHGCVFTLAIFETDDTPEMAIVSAQVPVEKFVIDFDEFDLSKFAELESLESSEIYDEFRESLFGLYQFCCKLPKLEDARYVFKVFMEHAVAMDESVENSENWLKINPKKNTKLRGENTLEKTTRQFQGQKSGLLGVDLGEELILYEYYQCSKNKTIYEFRAGSCVDMQ